jgi:hypothetical protein
MSHKNGAKAPKPELKYPNGGHFMDSLQAGRVNFGVLGLVLEVSGLGFGGWGMVFRAGGFTF